MREWIVVEGPRDVLAVEKAGYTRVLTTEGCAMPAAALLKIRRAALRVGVVLFTDPDGAGAQIRTALVDEVGPCKHAHLSVEAARRGDNIGVENASPEAIRAALESAHMWYRDVLSRFSEHDLVRWNLTGDEHRSRRHQLCETLHLGRCSAPVLRSRLNHFLIERQEVLNALQRLT